MSCPAALAYIPDWPHPVIRPNTSRGLRSRHTSGPMPRRSITPGRKPSISASADDTRSSMRGDSVGMLEVDGDVATTAQQHVVVRCIAGTPTDGLGTLDTDHLGAHVGQHHRRKRAGADAGQFDDAVTGERTRHSSSLARPVARRAGWADLGSPRGAGLPSDA